jgi:hypothetical protein
MRLLEPSLQLDWHNSAIGTNSQDSFKATSPGLQTLED